VDERGEVELELVSFAARVRALDLAELALEAEVVTRRTSPPCCSSMRLKRVGKASQYLKQRRHP